MGRAARRFAKALDPRNVTVGRDGTGDFSSLKDALDYVGRFSNTVANFAVIKVGPGTHTLNNSTAPVTLPAFIAIIGDSEATTNIIGTDSTKDLLIADSLYCANIAFTKCAYAIRHSGGGTCYIRECEADGATDTCGGLLDSSSSGLTFVQRSSGAFTAGTFIRVTAGTAVAIDQCNSIFHSGTNAIEVSGGSDVQINRTTITNNAITCFKFSGGAITSTNNLCKNIGVAFDLSGASGSLFSKNDVVRFATAGSAKDLILGAGMAFTYSFINSVFTSTRFTLNGNAPPKNYTDLATNNFNIGSMLSLPSTGAAPTSGNAVLVGGTVTVNTTAITATSVVILTPKTAGGTIGTLTYTITAGASFTITSSSGADTSTISWLIVENY